MIRETFMIMQGEIWEVEFFPNIGSEIGKKRPAIVVSYDTVGKLPLKTVVPITEWSNSYLNYPWMIKLINDKLNGLTKPSAIDCFQIRNFSDTRFGVKLGEVDNTLLLNIHQVIAKTLNPKYRLV